MLHYGRLEILITLCWLRSGTEWLIFAKVERLSLLHICNPIPQGVHTQHFLVYVYAKILKMQNLIEFLLYANLVSTPCTALDAWPDMHCRAYYGQCLRDRIHNT